MFASLSLSDNDRPSSSSVEESSAPLNSKWAGRDETGAGIGGRGSFSPSVSNPLSVTWVVQEPAAGGCSPSP